MARAYVGPAISMKIPADLLARIDAAAAEDGTNRSELIRVAAEEYLTRRARKRKS